MALFMAFTISIIMSTKSVRLRFSMGVLAIFVVLISMSAKSIRLVLQATSMLNTSAGVANIAAVEVIAKPSELRVICVRPRIEPIWLIAVSRYIMVIIAISVASLVASIVVIVATISVVY
jgi:hypothetical protein